MNALHDDGPTTPREGLEWLEFFAQDHYSIDPNLRTAVELLEAELVRVGELEKACELAAPAMASLMDELGHRKATDWGLVNDALVKIERLNRQARAALEGGE